MKTKRVKLILDAAGCPTNYQAWYEDNCARIVGATHRGYWSIIRRCEKDIASIPSAKERRWMIGSIILSYSEGQMRRCKA